MNRDQFLSTLRSRFGFEQFRPGQIEALEALFETGRLLAIQPTGRGKSLLYQLSACLLDGMTVVISPLLALMRDQVGQLKERFQIPAGAIHSDQTPEENEQIKLQASAGRLKILFLSPEQLDHVDRFAFFLTLPLSLLVIDEAHCISSWGHDFRPAFRQILQFVQAAEERNFALRVLGLTATASSRVEKDICARLFPPTKPARVLRESMDRPNISLSVYSANGIAAKMSLMEQILKDENSALVYCATRENTEMCAGFLASRGIRSIAYHAGLDPEVKISIQQAFMKGEYRAIAATNALGMGIDKPDIRMILHFDIPGSITAYYQEVGRAGRDGLEAKGILLFDPKDRAVQEYFIHSAVPHSEDFNQVLSVADGLGLVAIKQKTGLHPTRANVVVAELIEQGYLIKESVEKKQIYRRTGKEEAPDLHIYEQQRQVKLRELSAMIRYASADGECRMATLRRSLGDDPVENCARCDGCQPAAFFKPQNLVEIEKWLQERPPQIPGSKMHGLFDGISLLDAKLRSPLFVRFMQQRQNENSFDPELLELLKRHLKNISIRAVVPLPSQTWKGRNAAAKAIADFLNVPALLDLLVYKNPPAQRQGELLNNDQRKVNVQETMEIATSVPAGPLLLLDDYIGSGATLKEAARALRQSGGKKIELIPFTVAAVKWRLGQSGFI